MKKTFTMILWFTPKENKDWKLSKVILIPEHRGYHLNSDLSFYLFKLLLLTRTTGKGKTCDVPMSDDTAGGRMHNTECAHMTLLLIINKYVIATCVTVNDHGWGKARERFLRTTDLVQSLRAQRVTLKARVPGH